MMGTRDLAIDDLASRYTAHDRVEIEFVLDEALRTVRRSVSRADLLLAADLADLRLAIRSQHLAYV